NSSLQYVGLTKGTDSRRGQSVTLSRHPPARGTKSGHFGHYVARAGVSDVTDRCICLTWKGLAIPRSAPHLHCKWCGFVILGPQGIKSVMKEVHNLLLLGFSFLSIALLLRRNFSAGRKKRLCWITALLLALEQQDLTPGRQASDAAVPMIGEIGRAHV